MSKMIIETYWEEVDKTKKINGLHPVIRGHFVLKSITVHDAGWKSRLAFYRERVVAWPSFAYRGRVQTDKGLAFKFKLPTYYGIRSYQLIYPTGYIKGE